YDLFRHHHYSYYLSDDRLPDYIAITTGGAGKLRREVQKMYDFHGTNFLRWNRLVEVARVHPDGAEAVYAPTRRVKPLAMVVEGLSIRIWVSVASDLDPTYFPLHYQIVVLITG